MGRHSSYTPEIGDEIIERLSNGEPLRQICRDEHIPKWDAVYRWMDKDPEFAQRIARAREIGEDAIAQEALLIADTPLMGERTKTGKDGTEVWEEDMLGHRKLQIETRLKLLAKWNPKKWGEKVTQTVEGGDKPVQIDNVSEVEAARRVAFLLTKAAKAKE